MIFLKILLAIIGLVVLLYSGLLVYIYLTQERLLMHPQPLPKDFVFNFKGHFEEHFIAINDEVTLNALRFLPNVEAIGRVIYFHGNAGELDSWGEVAPHFTARGFELFIVDYRGYGKSTGKPTSEEDLHEDAEATLAYASQHFPDLPVVLYGRSLGTGIATRLATRHTPAALILESPYNNLVAVAQHHVRFLPVSLLMKYRLQTDKILANVDSPVYIIHGTKDATIPFALALKLKDVGHRNLHFYQASQAQHNNLDEYMEYGQMLDAAIGPMFSAVR